MPQTTEFRLGVDGVAAFEFSDGTTKNVDLANVSAGATVDAATMSSALAATDVAGRANFRNSGFISTHVGVTASTSTLVTLTNVRIGDTVKVTATSTDWRLDALPASTLSNWRNLGTSGSSVTVVDDLTTGGTTSALSAEQGKILQSTKSTYNAPAIVNSSSSFTAALYADRRSDVNSATQVTLTFNTGHGFTTGQCGRFVQTGSAPVVIVQGTGTLSRSPNVATGPISTTTIGSWIDWEYIGSDTLLITQIGVSTVSTGLTSAFAMPIPVADVGSNSTAETVVFETTVPALGPNSEVDIWIMWDGTGSGNKSWRLKIGGTTTGGTTIQNSIATSLAGRIRLGFRNQNSTASQVGGNVSIPTGVGTTTSSNVTSAVETSGGIRVALILLKSTAADVVNFQGGRMVVYQ